MAGWEQTIIVGNVGRAVEMRYTQAGVPVCDFSVAVSRKVNDQDVTKWYRVTCWRQLAEIAAQYVTKGMQIMVVGAVEASAYTDKQGNPAASLDLTAFSFQMLSSGSGQQADTNRTPYDGDDTGSIPF